jgi:hypothetical protein
VTLPVAADFAINVIIFTAAALLFSQFWFHGLHFENWTLGWSLTLKWLFMSTFLEALNRLVRFLRQ